MRVHFLRRKCVIFFENLYGMTHEHVSTADLSMALDTEAFYEVISL